MRQIKQQVDWEQRGMVVRYPGVEGLWVLTGAGMRRIRRSAAVVRQLLQPVNIFETHIPFMIPQRLTVAASEVLQLHGPPLRDGRSNKLQGHLVTAGAHVGVLPYFQRAVHSYRNLPIGIYALDAAWREKADAWEDIACINGADVEAPGATPRILNLIDDVLRTFGLPAQRIDHPANNRMHSKTVWQSGDMVIAIAETVNSVAFGEFRIRYDTSEAREDADVTFFYISQDVLLQGTEKEEQA